MIYAPPYKLTYYQCLDVTVVFMHPGILGGNPVLLGIQRLRTPFLNVVMGGISFLGEEEFYTLLIPVVAWIYEARLGRLLALLMALAFYCTGQSR